MQYIPSGCDGVFTEYSLNTVRSIVLGFLSYIFPFYLPKLAGMTRPPSAYSYVEVSPFPFVAAALHVAPNCSACVG